MSDSVRIDKWLWAVRIFKTRSQATEACKKGRVSIGDLPVKPSREVQAGEVVNIRVNPITRSYKVLDVAEKRMSAKLTPGFVEDVTPEEELYVLEMQKHVNWSIRERGAGRPTKKDRRDLEDFFNA